MIFECFQDEVWYKLYHRHYLVVYYLSLILKLCYVSSGYNLLVVFLIICLIWHIRRYNFLLYFHWLMGRIVGNTNRRPYVFSLISVRIPFLRFGKLTFGLEKIQVLFNFLFVTFNKLKLSSKNYKIYIFQTLSNAEANPKTFLLQSLPRLQIQPINRPTPNQNLLLSNLHQRLPSSRPSLFTIRST